MLIRLRGVIAAIVYFATMNVILKFWLAGSWMAYLLVWTVGLPVVAMFLLLDLIGFGPTVAGYGAMVIVSVALGILTAFLSQSRNRTAQ